MIRKEWKVSELQNLLSMIMDGFAVGDMMTAFKCSKKQIYHAVKKHFESSVLYIRMKYNIEVIK
ncbi:hypothetical protein [Pseudoalteromonas phage PHS21]|nr:hypothetical protein [Pseudoalteromonas phage PHS21]